MVILNISQPTITIVINGKIFSLSKNDIEKRLGNILIENITHPTDFFVINGPGSFTTLRIATLLCNLLNSVQNNIHTFYEISKIDFLSTLYQKKIIPARGLMRIGQKKNIRYFNADDLSHTLIPLTEGLEKINDGFVEEMEEISGYHNQIITYSYQPNSIIIHFQGKSHSVGYNEFPWSQSKILIPNYQMEPNISQPNHSLSFV